MLFCTFLDVSLALLGNLATVPTSILQAPSDGRTGLRARGSGIRGRAAPLRQSTQSQQGHGARSKH